MKSKPKSALQENAEKALLVTQAAGQSAENIEPEFDLVEEDVAASMIHWSVSTLQKDRVTSVRVPFVKLGRRVLYRRADLKAFVAANVRRAPAAA